MTWLLAVARLVILVIAGSLYARRSGRRALLRFRVRVARFKFATRKSVRERLLHDPVIAGAVRDHALAAGQSEAAAWKRVDGYIREIVPFFNVVAYYSIG